MGVPSKQLNGSSHFWQSGNPQLILQGWEGNSGISKIRVLPQETFSQTLDSAFCFFQHGTSIIASVVYHTERPPLFTTQWVRHILLHRCCLRKPRLVGPPCILHAHKHVKDTVQLYSLKPRPHQQQCRSHVPLCRSNIRLCCQKRQKCGTCLS